jgi:hypothetical protein
MSRWKCVRPVFSALIVGFFVFSAPAVPGLAGQGAANPAGITGVVTDNTGAVLPGVTVTATSPALQVPSVTSLSDDRGGYRLSPLPIGVYTVLFELPGFQNVRREGVRLTVGFTARVDSEMNVGAVSETVTVSGASPLVDTTSTATSTELTNEQIEVLPTSRDGFHSFMNQVPGVRTNLDVGSSGLGDTVQFRVYGQIGQPWQMVEGVLTSSTEANGDGGSHIDYTMVDGTRVQTVGSNAEMPRRGLLVDSVVKSGGNDFHGSAVAYGSGPQLEGNNIDDTLKAAGIRLPKLETLQDFTGTVGGRIIRNKLWFFGGARYQKVSRQILDAFDPDGTPILNDKGGRYYFEKVSYQATEGNRFTHFYHSTNDLELRGAGRFVPRESMEDKNNPVWMTKGEWQTVRGNSLVASVQSGRWDYGGKNWGLAPGKVSTTDIATQQIGGNFWAANGLHRDMGRNHTKGVVSFYKPDLWGGNHDFKVGADHLWSWWADGDIPAGVSSGHRAGENNIIHRLVFNNGAPFQLTTKNSPVKPANNGQYLGVYGQDSWTIARRITLNLGLRVDHDSAWRPEQCRVAAEFAPAQCWDRVDLRSFTSLAPRLALALDVAGDGKTVLKGGYGRFNQLREILPDVTSLNENLRSRTTWDWHDTNGNRQYDAGEVNLDPNGPDFRSIEGTSLGVVNPDEGQPKTDEFSLTFERELIANTAVRVTGVYSRNFNVFGKSEISRDGRYTIPITNTDPGPDGRRGTADDPGTSITYYEYPAALGGAAFARTMQVNDDALEQTFKTFEVAFTKRPSNNWQLNVSYSGTWINVPVTCGSLSTGTGLGTGIGLLQGFNNRCLQDPNTTFNTAQNYLEAGVKISGAYNLPYGILASANYDIRNGAPQARRVLFTGGQTIRSIELNVEPIGTFSLPNTHELDVRAAKRVNLGGARSVELRFDIYNALNKGTVRTQTLRSGADYLRPSLIMFPRILQIGATFMF